MRKLGILLGLIVGILAFQGASFAQINMIPELYPMYFTSAYIQPTGLYAEDENSIYAIVYRQNTTSGWIYFDLVIFDKSNRILQDIRELGSIESGKYETQYWVKGCAFQYYNSASDFFARCMIGNNTYSELISVTPSDVALLSTYDVDKGLKGLRNIYEFESRRYNFTTTIYAAGGRELEIIDNLGKTYDLYVPSAITKIYEAWGLFDAQAQKYFVFVVAEHQSYPGYRYLYALRYDSNRNYETTKVMLNTFEVAYMIPYARDLGNYRLILYDYTNNRY